MEPKKTGYLANLASSMRLALLAAAAAFLISIRYTEGKSFDLSEGLYAYSALMGNLYLISILINLLVGILFSWSRKVLSVVQIAANAAFLFWILGDTFVFQQYKFHINYAMIDLAVNAGTEVFAFSGKLIGILAACAALVAAAAFAFVKISASSKWPRAASIFGHLVLFSALLGANATNAVATAKNTSKLLVLNDIPPLYYPVHANRFLMRMGFKVETQSTTYEEAQENASFYYPLKPVEIGKKTGQNVVIVAVDALRADVFTKDVFPATFSREDKAVFFNEHFSGGSATRAGIFTLFYGIPSRYWQNSLSTGTPPVLIDSLRKAGYDFGIFTSANLKSPEFYRTVFATVPNLRLDSRGANSVERDYDALNDFKKFINERKEGAAPFFSFVFFDSLHAYQFPEDFKLKFEPSWKTVNQIELNQDFDPIPYFNRYKNSAHFVDALVDEVLKTLEAKGLDKNTIVMITSDHGEEFNDNKQNFWGHNGNFSRVQTHIPLMVLWPGKAARKIEYRTAAFDVSTTILEDVLGVKQDRSTYTMGVNLWEDSPRDPLMLGGYHNDAVLKGDEVLLIDKLGVPRTYSLDGWKLLDDSSMKAELPFYFEAKSRFLKNQEQQ